MVSAPPDATSTPDFLGQLQFRSLPHACSRFTTHAFRPRQCRECGLWLTDHAPTAVALGAEGLEQVGKFIAAGQAGEPANRVELGDGLAGKLWIGGFEACRARFLREHDIAHAVNCAKGLEAMFPKWAVEVRPLLELGQLEVLRLELMDYAEQALPPELLVNAVRFVHRVRAGVTNCLVHCAQGKSRSGAVTVAYVMACLDMGVDEALAHVRRFRGTVEPNEGFMSALRVAEPVLRTCLRPDTDD
ncbi:protein-tyrosine phosphatase-like protein [Hyaloraphidium curvatum]|nr:protein-tyrosine phosphatase-like protein [Hyaloraphidium curvatum]